ncbi:uncharacterized protein LOC114357573 isoform X3 [Ostrinia furnacalis]|uniref:uncharacterized protein LOC114357573 isoform X3 n=1 Tax=Ostrinia furnacalis TaxID=93504 RepID=UPI00103C3BF9|nr:uncharacterized protein LOC114357573 isoform X3 [Ostrinia furnacalis]
MAWRVGIEPPKSYLHLLYEHEEEAIDLGVDVIKEESDDEEDVGEYEMATDEMAPDEMAPDEMAPDEVAPGSFTEHFTEHLEGTRSRSRSPHTWDDPITQHPSEDIRGSRRSTTRKVTSLKSGKTSTTPMPTLYFFRLSKKVKVEE